MKAYLGSLLLGTLLLFGTGSPNPRPTRLKTPTIPDLAFRLEAKVETLEEKLETVLSSQDVYLDVSKPDHFQRLDSEVGIFLVSLKDVQPYLDCHKVWLRIGNPGTGRFDGFSFEVGWGKEGDTIKGKLRRKAFSFTQTLLPGS